MYQTGGNKMGACPVCKTDLKQLSTNRSNEYVYVDCPRCGSYELPEILLFSELISEINISERQWANISGYIREHQNMTIFTEEKFSSSMLLNLKTPSFHERADKLLLFFEKETEYAGKKLEKTEEWISRCWAMNKEELDEILLFLKDENRINSYNDFTQIKITPDGWKHLETLKTTNPQSDQCFVAMWFDDSLNEIYDKAIAPGISDAGYTPHRVDQRDHNRKIDDEIIAQIKRSRLLLADFTKHRPGVYYEAGFAQGLNLEVIWSCRKDQMKKLHFDVRQYNCIKWTEDNLEDFRKRITNRIAATVGWGPKPTGRNPNPSTKE